MSMIRFFFLALQFQAMHSFDCVQFYLNCHNDTAIGDEFGVTYSCQAAAGSDVCKK